MLGPEPPAKDAAPAGEPDPVRPHVQYGRLAPDKFIAVSGPVASEESFDTISLLFADLASGQVFATTDPRATIVAGVFDVNVLDASKALTSLFELAR